MQANCHHGRVARDSIAIAVLIPCAAIGLKSRLFVLHSPPPSGATMAFVRSIGRWTMTALVINGIIGGGIFALPGELNRLLRRASPFAVIFAALAMAIIMACVVEMATQFSEPGGVYLYTRSAFGRFVGIQIG